MIVQTIGESEFIRAFENYNRMDNFSHAGLRALFEYLEELSDDIGQPIELDVIALCCDYTEYSDIEEFRENYSDEYETIEDIENYTSVIRINGDSFIVQDF